LEFWVRCHGLPKYLNREFHVKKRSARSGQKRVSSTFPSVGGHQIRASVKHPDAVAPNDNKFGGMSLRITINGEVIEDDQPTPLQLLLSGIGQAVRVASATGIDQKTIRKVLVEVIKLVEPQPPKKKSKPKGTTNTGPRRR
jgi:hypothetical protein